MWVSLTTAVSNVASPDEAECVSAMIYDLWRCGQYYNDYQFPDISLMFH